jgi:hypothetical protein
MKINDLIKDLKSIQIKVENLFTADELNDVSDKNKDEIISNLDDIIIELKKQI